MEHDVDFVIRDGLLARYRGPGGDVAIPAGVTGIGPEAFASCRAMTRVTIPDGVTEIGEAAFSFCNGLTEISLPDSVTRVGNQAFWFCVHLRSASLGKGVTEIGDEAFWSCKRLARVALPAGLTHIGSRVFFDCDSLMRAEIPAGVTRIGDRTFENCRALTDATLPEGLTDIGKKAFSGCQSLRHIAIPPKVARIREQAFSYCLRLERVDFPAGLKAIDSGAFNGCEALAEAAIPAGVTDIGSFAFCGCAGLAEAVLPSGVKDVGQAAFADCTGLVRATIPDALSDFGAFAGCTRLREYAVPRDSRKYSAVDGVVFSRDGRRLVAYPPGRACERYDIPATVVEVGSRAFAGAAAKLVFVPAGVEKMSVLAATGEGDGDPYVAHSRAAFTADLGKPVYLGPPDDLSIRQKKRAVDGFLYALETGLTEMEPWKERYIEYIRQEYVTWEKKAWKDEAMLRLLVDRRMLRADTARNMRKKYAAAGRADLVAALTDYLDALAPDGTERT